MFRSRNLIGDDNGREEGEEARDGQCPSNQRPQWVPLTAACGVRIQHGFLSPPFPSPPSLPPSPLPSTLSPPFSPLPSLPLPSLPLSPFPALPLPRYLLLHIFPLVFSSALAPFIDSSWPSLTSSSLLASFLDVSFSDSLCGSWAPAYSPSEALKAFSRPLPPPISCRPIPQSSWAPLASSSPLAPFLDVSFSDSLYEAGGLGDFLTGLATAFACALLSHRAFLVRHPYLPLAFAPNLVDWSWTPDVPVEPARKLALEDGKLGGSRAERDGGRGGDGGGEGGSVGGEGRGGGEVEVQEGEVVVVDFRNRFVEPEEVFGIMDKAMNVRVTWNRGLLTYLLVQAFEKKWADRLKDMGMRPPFAFGCILRFLLKPQPAVISRVQAIYHHLLSPPPSSFRPSHPHPSYGPSNRGVVVVGMHIRAGDTMVWEGEWGFGDPKALNATQMDALLSWADQYISCAKALGEWWVPSPPYEVRWLVVTNSLPLKTAPHVHMYPPSSHPPLIPLSSPSHSPLIPLSSPSHPPLRPYHPPTQALEEWWVPSPPYEVRWLVVTNSLPLKTALWLKYPHRVRNPFSLSVSQDRPLAQVPPQAFSSLPDLSLISPPPICPSFVA
ncbi:unnamed protein product [Closterium sp. Naga37s-1]|nr:unnamed protein product [Closterium sp. Naga37s-1]